MGAPRLYHHLATMAGAAPVALVEAAHTTGFWVKSPDSVMVEFAVKFFPNAAGPRVTVAVHVVGVAAGAMANNETSFVGLATVGAIVPKAAVADAWSVIVGQVPPFSLKYWAIDVFMGSKKLCTRASFVFSV